MERRSFFAAIGAAILTAPAAAQQPPANLPAPSPSPRRPYKALADASLLCVSAGEDCLKKAFSQFGARDVSLLDCARSGADVVAACGALASLSALGAPFATAFARTVANLCLACKKDCDRFTQIAECAALGAACAACADECRKISG